MKTDVGASFERLALSCIDADFCDQILVGKLSTRSTRCTFFCTALISKFQEKSRHDFGKNESIHNSIHSNVRKFDNTIAILLRNFDEFFSTASVNDVEFVVSTLFDYFDALISTARNIDVTKQILDKIDSLKEKSSYPKYIEFLRKYVEDNRMIVPHTFCHGDLTFANIIFHQNRLFFIDFLDCYVDTFLSDLVKLKQDLHHLWAVRNQDVYTNRIHQIYEYIWDKLEVRYADHMTDSFHILDVMNALRIEPYLTSDSQRVILEGIVKSTELYAISYCSDGGAIN